VEKAIGTEGPDRTRIRNEMERQKNCEEIGGTFNRNENTHDGLNKNAFVLVVVENGG